MPARCNAWSCEVCAPSKAYRLLETLTFAARQHRRLTFWTLSQAPEDWQRRRQKVRDLRRLLTKRDLCTEYFWTTEPGSGGMPHVHALAHGDPVSQPLLEQVWGSNVDTRPVRPSQARQLAGYALKQAFADLPAHLALNGSRGASWTSGYLGSDLRTTQAALRVEQGRDRLSWHLLLPTDRPQERVELAPRAR